VDGNIVYNTPDGKKPWKKNPFPHFLEKNPDPDQKREWLPVVALRSIEESASEPGDAFSWLRW
jgi:hypothetical protein